MFRKLLLAASIAAAAGCALPAAASQTVGSADGGNCYPFVCNDGGSSINYYQIYSAAAFSGPITFDTITFFNYAPFGPAEFLSGDYDISFGVTSDPIGSAYPVSMANVASFYVGGLSGPDLSISGAAYAYDPGDGNLVMHVLASNQPSTPNGAQSNFGYMDADYTVVDVSRAYENSEEVYGGDGALVTRFSSTGGAPVPEPGTWALMLLGFGALGGALRLERRRPALAR